MKIYLIRHGQTTMNALGKIFCGSTDVHLSEKGLLDTSRITNNECWKDIEHIYITPLIRTHETANAIFPPNIPRTIIKEFAEMDFGSYEGKFITEENKNELPFYNWTHNPSECEFPDGDNLLQHGQDAYNKLMEIIKKNEHENIVIVSHATTIRLILSLLITNSVDYFKNIPCDNSCVTLLTYNGNEIEIKYINSKLNKKE